MSFNCQIGQKFSEKQYLFFQKIQKSLFSIEPNLMNKIKNLSGTS
ncbi:hypothetical protein LLB_2069 [Legionella longbeachae D-4968]|nr:hypothetical protein LLB_2069 [Legionella longbeachae D-4968]